MKRSGSGKREGGAGPGINIKHGLRSHLNVIIGYSQYLAKSGNITEAQKKQIEMIQDNGYYLLNWIDEIFSSTRTGGKLITESYLPEKRSPGPVSVTGYEGDVRRILIVDDWEAARIFLSDLLASMGFEIAQAVDGADCLEKIESFRPHAVLLDLILPVMGGLEIMKELKAGDRLKEMKVIMVTANDSQEVRESSMESGCADFITKPIKFDELFTKLEKHLDLKWVHGGTGGTAKGEREKGGEITGPPADLLGPLSEAARIYDYRGLGKALERLESRNAAYGPFAQHIRSLAENFEMREILRFLGKYTGQ